MHMYFHVHLYMYSISMYMLYMYMYTVHVVYSCSWRGHYPWYTDPTTHWVRQDGSDKMQPLLRNSLFLVMEILPLSSRRKEDISESDRRRSPSDPSTSSSSSSMPGGTGGVAESVCDVDLVRGKVV